MFGSWIRPGMLVGMIAAGFMASGCAPSDSRKSPEIQSKTPESKPETREFSMTGIVRRVVSDERLISIEHDDIPDLMPAMVMDFQVPDTILLDDVFPGDEVQGTLVAHYGPRDSLVDLELTSLEVTRPGVAVFPEEPVPAAQVLEPGQEVPDFQMTDQDGNPLRLSDLRGKVVVLTFVYTRCPLADYCPLMDKNFGRLAELAERRAERADQIRLLSISFDPEHDTPKRLTEHAARVGAKGPLWTYTVASHDELRKVAEGLGLTYYPRSNTIEHSLSTAVIGPDGKLISLIKGNGWDPNELFQQVLPLLNPAGDNG